MESELPRILSWLNRPDHRLSKAVQHSVKAVHYIAFKVQAQIEFYVLLKRTHPVSLPLPGVCALPPYPVSHTVTYPLHYDPYRCMVPGPVPQWPDRIHTTAISADVALQADSAAVSVKIRIDKPVAPYPPAFTVGPLAD